jgi:hypothetical protein
LVFPSKTKYAFVLKEMIEGDCAQAPALGTSQAAIRTGTIIVFMTAFRLDSKLNLKEKHKIYTVEKAKSFNDLNR